MNIDRFYGPEVLEIDLNGEGLYSVKVFLHKNPTYAQAMITTPENTQWHAALDNAIVALLTQRLYAANNRIEELEELSEGV